MLVGLGLPMVPTNSRSAERRLYWTGTLIATVSAFFVLYPPDWRGGLIFSAVLGAVLVFRAYMTRDYIRIGGRIYAFNLSDSHADDAAQHDPDYDPAPDSYAGFATATKTWWLFALVMLGCGFIVAVYLMDGEGPWYALGATVAVVLAAVLAGNQDASWGYDVARGQWLQFVIAGIATLAVFTVLYLVAYAIGKRLPLRPKRSLEYRAHPHLRKKYP
jgi:drug/metabolite transporter (DMT)-like permease